MIFNNSVLTVDKFIDEALYNKKSGYYFNKNPLGKSGDFITAPKVSPIFSEIITILSKVQIVNILVKDKSDKKIVIFFLKILGARVKNINLIICKTDRARTRNFLPIFLKDKNNEISSYINFYIHSNNSLKLILLNQFLKRGSAKI